MQYVGSVQIFWGTEKKKRELELFRSPRFIAPGTNRTRRFGGAEDVLDVLKFLCELCVRLYNRSLRHSLRSHPGTNVPGSPIFPFKTSRTLGTLREISLAAETAASQRVGGAILRKKFWVFSAFP